MDWGEYSARAPAVRSAIGLAIAAALVTGCTGGGSDGAGGNGRTEAVGEVGLPPFLAASRAVDIDQLSVEVTVGGTALNDDSVRRSGDVWIATFTLPSEDEPGFPADGDFPIEVLWSYAVTGRADPIPIAIASSAVSLDDSRAIRINFFDTLPFDADGDGVDNFAEIDAGTDPLGGGDVDDDPGLAARADQGDCRTTRLPGALPADENAPRDVFRFGDSAFAETVAVDFEVERRVYYATLVLERGGNLVIEHRSGLPTNTNALLYDRSAGAVGFEGSAIVSVQANATETADGVPARIATRLPLPGLYCYVLFDEFADEFSEAAPLSDLVIRVEFTPDDS